MRPPPMMKAILGYERANDLAFPPARRGSIGEQGHSMDAATDMTWQCLGA
jgi:hypothetical protein